MNNGLQSEVLKYTKVVVAITLLIVALAVIVGGVGNLRHAESAKTVKEREWLKGEGAFFVRKTCVSCHSISSLGIKAGNVGPDLSEAVADTERRFGKTIEQFLDEPTGTMSIVLSTKIPLNEVEKREAVRVLRIAYQRKLEQESHLK